MEKHGRELLGSGHCQWWHVKVYDDGEVDHGAYGNLRGLTIDVDAAWGWQTGWSMSTDCAEAMRQALNNWKLRVGRETNVAPEHLLLPFKDGEPRYHILYRDAWRLYGVRDRVSGLHFCTTSERDFAVQIADALNVVQGHPTLYGQKGVAS